MKPQKILSKTCISFPFAVNCRLSNLTQWFLNKMINVLQNKCHFQMHFLHNFFFMLIQIWHWIGIDHVIWPGCNHLHLSLPRSQALVPQAILSHFKYQYHIIIWNIYVWPPHLHMPEQKLTEFYADMISYWNDKLYHKVVVVNKLNSSVALFRSF